MKYRVIGDSTNRPQFSTHTIVSSINDAAKKIGLYDEDGISVKYDSLCQTHGDAVDCYISTYELSFPQLILDNANNKPIIGVSRDNQDFIINGGYNKDLVSYINLGVDSEKWSKINKSRDLDKFCVAIYTESLVRGGVELVIAGFAQAFNNHKDAVLKIKDRNGTETFRKYIEYVKSYYNINIEYINENWNVNQVKEWLTGVDCQIYNNRSSTFALPPLELMSCGIPTIAIPYSGPRDYCNEDNSLLLDYTLDSIFDDMNGLLNIGCRNFFLLNGYNKTEPLWASSKIDSISEKLFLLFKDEDTRKKISINGRKTAVDMKWENSAIKLSTALDRWFKE